VLQRLAKFLRKNKAKKNADITVQDLQDTIAMILFLKNVFNKVDTRHLIVLLGELSVKGISKGYVKRK